MLFVSLFFPYLILLFCFFRMSYIGFDIFFLSRYRITIVCFFVSFQILIAQCYSVISTSFFSEFSLTIVVGVTKVVQEVLSIYQLSDYNRNCHCDSKKDGHKFPLGSCRTICGCYQDFYFLNELGPNWSSEYAHRTNFITTVKNQGHCSKRTSKC